MSENGGEPTQSDWKDGETQIHNISTFFLNLSKVSGEAFGSPVGRESRVL